MPYKSNHLSVLSNFDNVKSISTIIHSPQLFLLISLLIYLIHYNEESLAFNIILFSLLIDNSYLIELLNFHTFHSIPLILQFSIIIILSN